MPESEMDEFWKNEDVVITVTFKDKLAPGHPLTNPDVAELVIQPGYDTDDAISIPLGDLSQVSNPGVFQYIYSTADVDTSEGPVEHVAQTEATSGLIGVSGPYYFRVLPPRVKFSE